MWDFLPSPTLGGRCSNKSNKQSPGDNRSCKHPLAHHHCNKHHWLHCLLFRFHNCPRRRNHPHHHHQPPPPFIKLPTPCRPPDLADSTRIVAVRGARAQPSDDGASPFSDSSDRQKCTGAASCLNYKLGVDHQYNTQQNMADSIKVKEDSTSPYHAPTVATMC